MQIGVEQASWNPHFITIKRNFYRKIKIKLNHKWSRRTLDLSILILCNNKLHLEKPQNKAKHHRYQFKRTSQKRFRNRFSHFWRNRKFDRQSNRDPQNRIQWLHSNRIFHPTMPGHRTPDRLENPSTVFNPSEWKSLRSNENWNHNGHRIWNHHLYWKLLLWHNRMLWPVNPFEIGISILPGVPKSVDYTVLLKKLPFSVLPVERSERTQSHTF